jgi:hypothetical protein
MLVLLNDLVTHLSLRYLAPDIAATRCQDAPCQAETPEDDPVVVSLRVVPPPIIDLRQGDSSSIYARTAMPLIDEIFFPACLSLLYQSRV